ncbi:hypothetical protein AAFF_G00107690 [Aldrovandia affinis]|uniref:Uncharacterized protein n=1 Tax=Aldrovandia affinis TaxID=143900 RepID=A0AAD7WBD8_9TELE|nr:hypothetical protein AAFF_G00107690 [Aldrovandia affinis]
MQKPSAHLSVDVHPMCRRVMSIGTLKARQKAHSLRKRGSCEHCKHPFRGNERNRGLFCQRATRPSEAKGVQVSNTAVTRCPSSAEA